MGTGEREPGQGVVEVGSFSVKEYEGYEGMNPRSGEKIKVQPKKLPFFKVGKDLREKVNEEK